MILLRPRHDGAVAEICETVEVQEPTAHEDRREDRGGHEHGAAEVPLESQIHEYRGHDHHGDSEQCPQNGHEVELLVHRLHIVLVDVHPPDGEEGDHRLQRASLSH